MLYFALMIIKVIYNEIDKTQEMPLIKQIHDAIKNGDLRQPFTTHDVKEWVHRYKIRKDDGTEYAESSINAILSNSNKKNKPTTNKNIKVLQSKLNANGEHEYWFLN